MRGWSAVVAVTLGLTMLFPTAATAAPSDDAIPLDCRPYLVDATGLNAVDLVMGTITNVTKAKGLTAAGYNVADSLVYAWDSEKGGIAALGTGTYEFLGEVPGLPDEKWDGGEVDLEGVFWLLSSDSGAWAGVDLATLSVTSKGTSDLRVGDWAVRADYYGALFTVSEEAFSAFATASGIVSEVGASDGFDGVVTAAWSDATQFLYLLIDDSVLVQTEEESSSVLPMAKLSAKAPTDGAWCHEGVLLSEWGDAPDSYRTSLASKGARHSVLEIAGNRAPLMLGEMLTIEPKGLLLDTDEDDGIASTLRVSATDPLSVDVIVTNTSSTDATLTAWLDVGASGKFAKEPDVKVAIPAESGTRIYQIALPAPKKDTWLRLRVAEGKGATTPYGAARGGEVEDWRVLAEESAPALEVTSAEFEDTELHVTLTNTGNAPLSPVVDAEGLCAPFTGERVLASGTSASASCSFEPPPGGTPVLIAAADGDVVASSVLLVWGTAEDDAASPAPAPTESAEPDDEAGHTPWLPFAIVGGGIALLALASVVAKRAARSDAADDSED